MHFTKIYGQLYIFLKLFVMSNLNFKSGHLKSNKTKVIILLQKIFKDFKTCYIAIIKTVYKRLFVVLN